VKVSSFSLSVSNLNQKLRKNKNYDKKQKNEVFIGEKD